jgi:large subunit ribosomal protein L25
LVLDLTGMPAGTSKTAADVKLPAGTTLVSDPELVVVHLSERSTSSDAETPAAAPAAEATPAATN